MAHLRIQYIITDAEYEAILAIREILSMWPDIFEEFKKHHEFPHDLRKFKRCWYFKDNAMKIAKSDKGLDMGVASPIKKKQRKRAVPNGNTMGATNTTKSDKGVDVGVASPIKKKQRKRAVPKGNTVDKLMEQQDSEQTIKEDLDMSRRVEESMHGLVAENNALVIRLLAEEIQRKKAEEDLKNAERNYA